MLYLEDFKSCLTGSYWILLTGRIQQYFPFPFNSFDFNFRRVQSIIQQIVLSDAVANDTDLHHDLHSRTSI